MPEISRPMLAVYALAALAVVALGVRWLGQAGSPAPAPTTSPRAEAQGERVRFGGGAGGPVVVHVAGAVRHPGVYRLRGGSRAIDALRRAGGATASGNPQGVDLAAKLADGVQLVIPERAGAAGGGAVAAGAGGGAAATGGGADAGGGAGAGASPATGPLSLNSATAEQLDALDGVGPETARKIIAYRVEHGGFGSVDELDRVPGIGAKKLAGLRPQVTP